MLTVCNSFSSSKFLFPLLKGYLCLFKKLGFGFFFCFIVLVYKTFFFFYLKRHISINEERCSNLISSKEQCLARSAQECFIKA